MTDDKPPRNVEDVDYAELDGARPMREVLRDRHARHVAQDKATREKAFHVRAGMQSLLGSCLCCYPLVKAPTSSEHEEWCPSHLMHLSSLEQSRVDAERAAGRMPR